MNLRLAKILSTIGHPLLTISIFVLIALFSYENVYTALVISILVIGCIILPLTIKMYRGSKNGTYTNFDVSNKVERQSWYIIALFLLSIITVIFFITNQSQAIKWSTSFFFLILLMSKFLNYYIKSSLHVSLNIFISFLIMPISLIFGVLYLVFVFFISWSRIALKRHSVKEVIYGSIVGFTIGVFSLSTTTGYAQEFFKNRKYTYAAPKQLNDGIAIGNHSLIDTSKIKTLTELILKNEYPNFHSLLIMKDNKLVYENYFAGTDEISGKKIGYIEHTADKLHDCRSISKSITSICVGIAVKQGLINSIEEPIAQYFPEYKHLFDTLKSQITVRHLLTMTGGFEWNEDISYRNPKNSELQMDISSDPIKYILSRPMFAKPGAKWNYNGGESQLLAQIILKVSGSTLDKFADQNLFVPLGIIKYQWLTLRENIPAAASGLRLTSRDMLKIGLLYMNDGKWKGKQIVDKEWAKTSLNSVVEREKKRGYGFQFWTYISTVNNKTYHISEAKGNGGQRIILCKDINLLVIATAGNYNKWDIINDINKAMTDFIIPSVIE